MQTVLRYVLACAVGLMIATSGCAPAYHDYSGCSIDCRYCPLPPLPYKHYKECVCHSCAASQHLAIQQQAAEGDTATDTYDWAE